MKKIIELKNIKKSYNDNLILNGINLDIYERDFIIISGRSGEGKSTLLNILSTIDIKEVKGSFLFNDMDILKMSDKQRTLFRAKNIGYIFQDFRLINEFSVLENVMVPAYINNLNKNEFQKQAEKLLKELEIDKKHFNKKPSFLSGGQQQRVAIARALIHSPKVVFADEPTGNLDMKSALKVIEILKKLSSNTTIVVVTHNLELFEDIENKRVLNLANGKLNENNFNSV